MFSHESDVNEVVCVSTCLTGSMNNVIVSVDDKRQYDEDKFSTSNGTWDIGTVNASWSIPSVRALQKT